jgi:hypothetical protein
MARAIGGGALALDITTAGGGILVPGGVMDQDGVLVGDGVRVGVGVQASTSASAAERLDLKQRGPHNRSFEQAALKARISRCGNRPHRQVAICT